MPVALSVRQVREALYRDSRGLEIETEGTASTTVLGQWFHDVLHYLVSGESTASPLTQLRDVSIDRELWARTLAAQAYHAILGPRLTREQAALHASAAEVLALWNAVQAACTWLADLNWELEAARQQRPSRLRSTAPTLSSCVAAEEMLSCELREPHWKDSVRLTGIPDAVLRLPNSGQWCALEFKLGKTAPVADLAQACLYHILVSESAKATGSSLATPPGSLALVSFRPERSEQLFAADQLVAARQNLMSLIGKLAGVDETTSMPSRGVATVRPTSTEPSPEHRKLGERMVAIWRQHNVDVSIDNPVIVGPTFIRFPITLGPRTRVASVERLAAELQLNMGFLEEPLISREQGQLVIDVQRPDPQTLYFDDIRELLPQPQDPTGGSHVPVGVALSGELVCADLSKTDHAHLLVVGTTGSGKSEWLRLAMAGLLSTNTPDTLRMLIIDPKRNAFHALRQSPYLWKPLVYPDEQDAAQVLNELVQEMERRYRIADGADNFVQMAARSKDVLPRIVCICDEYRDLISQDPTQRKAIEAQISRLGAKARASGIHLILATQEASRQTIKGPLDANMPARVGLKMQKSIESQMLLGDRGAESLLGHGDLLFKDVGSPRRLQAPLLSDANRAAIFGS